MKNNRYRHLAAKQRRFLKASLFSLFLVVSSASLYAQNCTINAGVDQTICANAAMTLSGSTSGLFQGAGTTTWSQLTGSVVTITSPNQLTTTVTGFAAGSYTFRISTTCLDGSAIYDDVAVTVSPVVVANAGADQTYCPGSANLAGNAPSPGTGAWSIFGTNSANLSITTSTSATSAVSLPTGNAGSTTLRWTITQGGCTSTDDVIITNRGGVTPVSAGPDQTLGNCYSSTTSATLAGSFAGSNVGGQGGLWSVVSGPNVPTITTPSSRTSTVTGLIQGVYVLQWTASGSCVSGTDDVQITVPAPSASLTAANAGSSQVYCDGRTAMVLAGNNPTYAGESVLWSQTAGPAGATITNASSAVTTVSGLNGSGTYTFRYAITNSNTGCSSTASITVSYNAAPSISVNSGADYITLACGTTFTSVPYTVSGGSLTQYRIISAPAGYTLSGSFSNASTSNTGSQTQSITGLTVPGTYLVRFLRSGGTGCTTVYDDVNIVVSKTPTPSEAGTYQTLACNVVSTSLAGNIPATGTGSWSQVSGPNTATIAAPAVNTSGIAGLINGRYVFKWIISGGTACPAGEDTVSVVVASATPSAANAGADRTVCHTTPITLGGNQPALNEYGMWTVSPSAGVVFSDAASATAVVTGLTANTAYTFTWTLSNACGSTSDNAVITTSSLAGPDQASAGADQCKPSGTTSATLSGTNSSVGATGLWSQYSGPSTASIATPAAASATITGITNGTYQFVRTFSLAGCGSTTDTVVVTVSAAATTANAGIDQSICSSGVTLAANTPTVGTGSWTQVAGPGGAVITSPAANNSTVSALVAGSYTFRWAIANNGCAGNYDDVVVNVSAPPSAANAGADQTCLTVTTATLGATAPASGTGSWSQVSGPSTATVANASLLNTGLSALVSGTYTFRWTVSSGPACADNTDDMVLSVNLPAGAQVNSTLCNLTTASLQGTANTSGTWSQVSGPGTAAINAYPGNTASAENLVAGVYLFRYALAAVGSCSAAQTDRQVTVYAAPSTAVAGVNQSLCSAGSFSLNANVPTSGSGVWSKVSGPASGSLSSTSSATPTVSGAATGLYTYQWTISTGTGCSNASQVTVNNAPLPSAANAGANQSFCGATTASLAATSPSAGTGAWTQVAGPAAATIVNPALASTSVSGLSNGIYTFRWTVSSGACSPATADVKIGVCSVLPLHLLSFAVEANDGYAQLRWKTANEEGVKHFVAERSDDGIDFMPLARIAGKNEALNAYAYDDNLNAFSGNVAYYRLRMVNSDGSFSYSGIIRLPLRKVQGLSLTVAPNPVRAKAVLQIESNSAGSVFIRVLNGAGKTVIAQTKILAEGSNSFTLEEPQALPNGLYIVIAETKEGTHSQKMIIQR